MSSVLSVLKKSLKYLGPVILVYAVYFWYPPYGLPQFLFWTFYITGIAYGILGYLAVKDALKSSESGGASRYWKRAVLLLWLGAAIFAADIIRTAGH